MTDDELEGIDQELDAAAPRFILLRMDDDGGLTYEISGWDGTEAIGPLTAMVDKLRADALDEWDADET